MSTLTLEQQCRKRVWNYFTYETARSIGLDIPQLQQFALGNLTLDADALQCLARQMKIKEYPVN